MSKVPKLDKNFYSFTL